MIRDDEVENEEDHVDVQYIPSSFSLQLQQFSEHEGLEASTLKANNSTRGILSSQLTFLHTLCAAQ